MKTSAEILFGLLQAALGDGSASAGTRCQGLDLDSVSGEVWKKVVDLSFDHGVAALAIDGLGLMMRDCPNHEHEIDKEELEELKYKWLMTVFTCESEAAARTKVAKKISRLFAPDGIRTIVLKGEAFAQYYPNPSRRYSCDLDIFIGDDWEKGCKKLERKGVDICYEVYKHAECQINKVHVECHRFLMAVRGNKTLRRMDQYLRGLLADGCTSIDAKGITLPPLMFNVLFCIEHARGHLLLGSLTLKQVCDWMLIRRQPVDWDEFWLRCDEFGLTRFAHLMDALADMIEGKVRYEELASVDRKVVDEMLVLGESLRNRTASKAGSHKTSSFFKRRVRQFFTTLRSGWKYKEFNDVPMSVTLLRQVWAHFFNKTMEL